MSDTPIDIIIDAGTIQTWVDTFRSIVDEASINFRDNEIYVEAIDPANVAMISQTLTPQACESYYAEHVELGLNLERLSDYLGKASSGDIVHLTYDEETRHLIIEYGDAHFTMSGIDPDAIRNGDTLPQEAIDSMGTDIELDSAAWKHGVDVAGMVSDHVEIDSDPSRENPFHMIGKGDTDDARVKYGESLHDGSEIDTEAVSLFSEDYLSDLTKPIPNGTTVRVRHGDEWPMLITYEYANGGVKVEQGLAPRIQSE